MESAKSIHYVNKQTVKVEIVTVKYKIRGKIHIIYNHRASDILNSKEQFIAVTDAEIFSHDNEDLSLTTDFLAINKNNIIYLIEINEPSGALPDD